MNNTRKRKNLYLINESQTCNILESEVFFEFWQERKKNICRLTFLIQRLYSRDVILEAIVVRVTMVLHTGYMWHKRSIHVSSAQNMITRARAI